MSDYELLQDVNVGHRPKEAAKEEGAALDHTSVAKAVERGRPDALGAKGAMHLQRAAGNAAMGSLVQRKADEESPVREIVGKGGGSSLDAGVRERMEASMGHDFGDVRVHTGSNAATAAKSVQAQAFTVGNELVFNEGKYNPSSAEGQRTIAHELTHVVQQRSGPVPGESREGGVKVSDPGDWAEQQAEATADRVMAGGGGDHAGHDHGGGAAGAVQTLTDPTIQREDEDEKQQEAPEEETEDAKDTGAEAASAVGPSTTAPQIGATEDTKDDGSGPESAEEEKEESVSTLRDESVQRNEETESEDEEKG